MKHIICLECPNGCNLSIYIIELNQLKIEGNRCEKGIAFAKKIIDYEKEHLKAASQDSPIISAEKLPLYSQDTLKRIAKLWQIELKGIHREKNIEGSPERTIFRIVIEDKIGRRYVLEQVPINKLNQKTKIVKTLEYLAKKNMPFIEAYISESEGRFILEHEGRFWQVTDYVEGDNLDRQKYLYEKWRAEPLVRFLVELRKKGEDIPYFKKDEAFSLISYIAELTEQVHKYRSEIIKEVDEVMFFLEKRFFRIHDKLPVSFCHGDYHPMNIIWGKHEIKRVIDWEFLGYKPEIYDAANMIGCLGIEHPSSLVDDLVLDFISQLRSTSIFSDLSWEYLLEFVIALRFAWLSEWLRKEDEEMMTLELDYMKLLIKERKELRQAWQLASI